MDRNDHAAPPAEARIDPDDLPGAGREEGVPPLTEAAPLAEPGRGRDNRGRAAAITENGEVIGSGAGAGGKGGPEDFDTDPQAGGGTFEIRHEDSKPDSGADASQHNSA